MIKQIVELKEVELTLNVSNCPLSLMRKLLRSQKHMLMIVC